MEMAVKESHRSGWNIDTNIHRKIESGRETNREREREKKWEKKLRNPYSKHSSEVLFSPQCSDFFILCRMDVEEKITFFSAERQELATNSFFHFK